MLLEMIIYFFLWLMDNMGAEDSWIVLLWINFFIEFLRDLAGEYFPEITSGGYQPKSGGGLGHYNVFP